MKTRLAHALAVLLASLALCLPAWAGVNHAPSGASKLITLLEDSNYVLKETDFGFSDPADVPPNAFKAVIIASLPVAGSLTLTGVTLTVGQTIAVADISASKFVFTPASNANGTSYAYFYFRVQDDGGTANGGIDTNPTPDKIVFNVSPVNDPPLANTDNFSTLEDQPLTITLASLLANDTDIEGDALLLQSAQSQVHGQLSAAAGNIVFTPDANYFGPASFTYTINDGHGGTATGTVNINVTPVNDPPVNTLPASPFAAVEDTRVAITGVSVSDADESSGIATQKLASVQLTVNNGTLRVTLDPGASISAGTNGNNTFTLGGTQAAINTTLATLSYLGNTNFNGNLTLTMRSTDNSGLFDQDTLTIAVSAVNDPPVANTDNFSTLEDQPLTITLASLLANDTDIDGDALLLQSAQSPVHGQLSAVAGNIVFTPDANYFGPASFTYTINDGNGGLATGTVNINVTPVNDPPVAVADQFTTAEDVPLSILPAALTANDSDVDGDPLQVASIANPNGGSVSFDGTFILFTPTPNYFGPASLTYTINDGHGGSATGTVNINVTATPIVLTLTNGPSANPFRFILRGHAGSVYSLLTSSNLHNWSTWRNITNTAGSTLVIDPSASNAPVRFYRAQFVQ